MDPERHPGGHRRFKILDETLKKHQYQPHALIEVLHKAQDLFGFLAPDVLRYVARALKLPPSRVWGVATFYHLFTLEPQGEHTCTVCLGTACYLKGADRILAAVEQFAHVRAGETTPDGRLSLLTARCIGPCGIAPAMVFDETTVGHLTPEAAVARVKGWLGDGSV